MKKIISKVIAHCSMFNVQCSMFMMAVACGVLFPAAATAQSYQLVTSSEQLESGKRYLIVAKHGSDYYAWNGFNTNKGDATTVSALVENVITPEGAVVPVQLVKSSDKWKMIDTKTENYLGVSTSNSENLVGESAPVSNTGFLWEISFDTDGTTKVRTYSNDSYHYLKYNYNTYGGSYSFYGSYGETDKIHIALYKETGSSLILYNGKDNTDVISAAATAGGKHNVILQNRTFFKDGYWNTLCLPFSVALAGSPLEGATVMEFDVTNTRLDGTTLYLNFNSATSIEAGKPYIIKWDNTSGTISSPTFSNVEISSTTSEVSSSDGFITFKGSYKVNAITGEDKSILFLGGNNNLYYPNAAMNINAFRAYFQLNNGLTAQVRSFVLNFDEEGEVQGITTTNYTNLTNDSNAWYSLDGRKVNVGAGPVPARNVGSGVKGDLESPVPAHLRKGLYIHGGRKVLVP